MSMAYSGPPEPAWKKWKARAALAEAKVADLESTLEVEREVSNEIIAHNIGLTDRAEAKRDRLAEALRGVLATMPYSIGVVASDTSLENVRQGLKAREEARAALAQIGDDEQSVEPEKPKRRFQDMPRSQQAEIKCNEPNFQRFLGIAPGPNLGSPAAKKWATRRIHTRLGIDSRSELDTNPEAAKAWDKLYAQYLADTGQMAEAR